MTASKQKRNEIILIAVLVLLVLSLLLINRKRFGSGAAVCAEVSVNGQVTEVYSLDEDVDTVIHGSGGGVNHLIIKDGGAAIIEASCPDKVCVHQGIVKEAGQALVCLPNKVIVTLK